MPPAWLLPRVKPVNAARSVALVSYFIMHFGAEASRGLDTLADLHALHRLQRHHGGGE